MKRFLVLGLVFILCFSLSWAALSQKITNEVTISNYTDFLGWIIGLKGKIIKDTDNLLITFPYERTKVTVNVIPQVIQKNFTEFTENKQKNMIYGINEFVTLIDFEASKKYLIEVTYRLKLKTASINKEHYKELLKAAQEKTPIKIIGYVERKNFELINYGHGDGGSAYDIDIYLEPIEFDGEVVNLISD